MSENYRTVVDPTATNNPHSYALQMIGGGHHVLEVGCSVGHVTEHLVAAGNTVVGVEIDRAAAHEAERWAARVHVRDLDTEPLSEVEHDRFDVILLGDVLEHFRAPEQVLADLLTLLTPDGRIVLSVPHVGFVDVRLMLLAGRWSYQDDGLLDRTHLRWFTAASIAELLAGAGLEATRVERVRLGLGDSGLPIPDPPPAEIVRFIEADPESTTFQFVVEARHRAEAHSGAALTTTEPDWPDLDGERARLEAATAASSTRMADLERHNAALQAEVDAWHNAKIVRLSAPLRSLWGRLRR
ncbi:MAG: class I SAM-dependent methyltransferase [Ilumatobacter sp.]|uniref:class I SAM-dependent methyltransferase n=1 Tax=Ilumatobacter sp. TaxID=1967498 RepID=UPI002626ECCF|nr:class I SAM-dependent methyltransferase [Ilumatobacter sp.]MDJ0771280.1 class I SAM-dependent methyltransferase [Ilumatobacter sp.]